VTRLGARVYRTARSGRRPLRAGVLRRFAHREVFVESLLKARVPE
jgi:hypothetical protein